MKFPFLPGIEVTSASMDVVASSLLLHGAFLTHMMYCDLCILRKQSFLLFDCFMHITCTVFLSYVYFFCLFWLKLSRTNTRILAYENIQRVRLLR